MTKERSLERVKGTLAKRLAAQLTYNVARRRESIVAGLVLAKPVRATLIVVYRSAVTACDPGYQFTVRNACDTPITVDLGDSNEVSRRGTGDAVTLEPHSTTSWTMIDADIQPPFGLLLVDGPRAGDRIKSETPDVAIPESACPQ